MFGGDEGQGRSVLQLTAAAFMFGIAIMMNVFACTLVKDKNLYPLLILFVQFLAPMPLALCGMQKSMSAEPPMFAFFGWFLTGMFLSVALGAPFAMLHEGSFNGTQLGLALGSQGLTYLVFAGLAKIRKHSGYDSF
eukprot:TRINITY_DN24152_c0_g1_i1.p1 TRINITY_DN24152_c0_g1~~TRINITY_DN24152_c0_g1_i1.p1  ORF type:complete len:153 (+),score=37.57 TRINITY_DN24152_c0_g1_i1:54-461(+)